MINAKKLDCTVRQGARGIEAQYWEERKAAGITLRGKYGPGGRAYKGVKNMTDGQGQRAKRGVNWGKGSGLGEKGKVHK